MLILKKIEYELLNSFVRNKGIILSTDKLIDLVWDLEYDGEYRTVDTHIRRLRSKIGEVVDLIEKWEILTRLMQLKI